jgi:hypothetical protein
MRYFSHQKPNKCPKCGSLKVVRIIYEKPNYKTALEAEAGKIILGDRAITGNAPLWGCIDCKTEIFKRKFRVFP